MVKTTDHKPGQSLSHIPVGSDRLAMVHPPAWAKRYLSDSEAQSCAEAIAQAELKTSGEIVVAIAKRSAPVRHIVLSLTMSFLCAGFLLQLSGLDLAGYAIELAALPSALLLSRWPTLQRLISFESDLDDAVNLMARSVFYGAGIERTAGATGVLIFISLMEHRVVVLGDRAIDSKLPHSPEQNTWSDVVQLVLKGKRGNSLANGINAAVAAAGQLLAAHFPAEKHNPDEVANHLVFVQNP